MFAILFIYNNSSADAMAYRKENRFVINLLHSFCHVANGFV